MDRFFGKVKGERAYIEDDFKHFKVKRIKKGETVEVINEENYQPYLCRVEAVEKRRVVCTVLERLPKNVPEVEITLLQCVPVKLQTMDFIVEKATEVGVSEIVPLISKRSFQDGKVIEKKIPRWEKIARETLKQCGRHKPLKLKKPIKLDELNGILERDALKVFPFESETGKSFFDLEIDNPQRAYLIVGPEGGFSKEEAELLEKFGFLKVSLGNFILKAETAAAVASAMLYNLLSRLDKG
jgi:16S rRNA (uracil1498-N3)-methyltransferase